MAVTSTTELDARTHICRHLTRPAGGKSFQDVGADGLGLAGWEMGERRGGGIPESSLIAYV